MYQKIILTPIFVILFSISAYAGGAVARRSQAMEQQQRAYEQAYRQAVEQQVQQQQQAVYEQMQQRQQQMQQYAYKQAVQKKIAEQQAVYQRALQQKAYEQAYQQKLKLQALQQQQAYQRVIQQKSAQQKAYLQIAQQRLAKQQAQASQFREQVVDYNKTQALSSQYIPKKEDIQRTQKAYVEPDEVITMDHLWRRLDHSSEVWNEMIDSQPKELTVARQIEIYRQEGVTIRKQPSHYVQLIDDMSRQNPDILSNPFRDVVKFMAIIEYDFDNGMDRDLLVRRLLGEQGYQSNRRRLGR
ncbi:MAG: hypothetical protein KC713_00155 [Candidatus Omnitrophica bacterium]|nr:hypothetical protein [Candidatus Omnitrophota bacterium]